MDFKNLESEETLKAGLNWIASYMEEAIINKKEDLVFTFKPNKDNSIGDIFNFVIKLKESLMDYGVTGWCVLDNVAQLVKLKIIF